MATGNTRPSPLSARVILFALLAVIGTITGFVLSSGGELQQNSAGQPRLVSVYPLPAMDGEMCQWAPASATSSTLASLRMQQRSAAAAAQRSDPEEVSQRPPLRVIRDPYAAYSAVAVDTTRGEVVLTDENLFNILVYDRLDNTPPTAAMTEPKRMIGGLQTKIEFQCGLYIDPTSGDIYAVNNDTVDTLVIFNRDAKGNVPPTRELYTPHGTFGITVDEQREELFLTIQHDNAVVVFNKMAVGDEPPLRLLQGDSTLLADPHGIAFDPESDLIFVTNHGSVKQVSPEIQNASGYLGRGAEKKNWPLGQDRSIPGSGKFMPPSISVYRRDASGDSSPLRVISGPKTQMNWPTGIAMDPERGEIYIANDADDSILVFSASASGDVAPLRVLKGPKSLIKNPTGVFLDSKNDEVWVSNFGNHTATVYKRGASGDTAPLRVIRSGPLDAPTPGMGNPHPVAYDSKREEILVPN
ncbi:MAG: hypothetical protein V3T65_01575 [Acidobacteriota bacterium]